MMSRIKCVCLAALCLAACGRGADGPGAAGITTTTRPEAFAVPDQQTSGTTSIDHPPAPGTYVYDQTGTTHVLDQGTEPKPIPAEGTLEVSPGRQAPYGIEQNQERLDGTGDRVEQTLLYSSDGVFLVGYETDISVAGSKRSFTCEPERPVQIFPAGVAAGDTWEDRVDCQNGQIHYSAVAEVSEDVTLGDGSTVSTLRVSVENSIDGEGLTTDSRYLIWVAPELGMSVKTQDATDAALSVYDVERRVVDLLRSEAPT